jgi:hypothetical protein
MGRSMFMSLEPTAQTSTATPYPVAPDGCALPQRQHPWYLSARWMLSIWAALSVIWGLAVVYDLCERVSTQADMSRDVENDLDQGFVTASCSGPQCVRSSANAQRTQNWSRIASTYIKFGSNEMAECIFGPPAALLVIGLGTVIVLRRRPKSAERTAIST